MCIRDRLSRVDDAVMASAYGGGFEFKDGVKQVGEYTYDANGNLTKDSLCHYILKSHNF